MGSYTKATVIQTPALLEVVKYNGFSVLQDSTAINLARKYPPSNINGPEIIGEFWPDSVVWPILAISQKLKKHVGAYFDTYLKISDYFHSEFPSRMDLVLKEIKKLSDLEKIAEEGHLRIARDDKHNPVFFAPDKLIEISTD